MDSQQRPRRRAARGSSATRSLLEGIRATVMSDEGDSMIRELPILPIRNAVILPHTVTPLYIDHERTRRAVEAAIATDGVIFAVTQRTESNDNPGPKDLYQMGVEAIIEKSLLMPEGVLSVVLRSMRRASIAKFIDTRPYLRAAVAILPEEVDESATTIAQMRIVHEHFEQVAKNNTRMPEEVLMNIVNLTDPSALADVIAMSLDMPMPIRQKILETLAPLERLALVDSLLLKELEILEMEARIHQSVQHELDRGQKEYYLREQIRVIQRELAENDPAVRESLDLRERIDGARMPDEVRTRALRELERLESMPTMAPEYTVLRTYLDWLIALPWQQTTIDQIDIAAAAQVLDTNHHGLPKVKERLLEFIAVRKLAPTSRSPILCLVGPPGVGKTSLGRSVAEALGRKFVRISLGGIRDEAEIRGHRRTYVGALPGRIIQTMRLAGTTNPLFVLDEIDKLAADYRGDPAAALLEVLDPEQNHAFSDHYLEVPYSLSQVIFILTANSLQPITSALLDRMEVIELSGYTEEEKVHIARNFLIPRQMKDHGLTSSKIELQDDALHSIIREYTREAGVRNLEREVGAVMRKVARRVAEGKRSKVNVTAKKILEFLGPQKAFAHEAEVSDQIGIAMGVAWTPAGGDLTPVEIAVLEGRGQILLTGQLGEVLRESAQAAISFARARMHTLGLPSTFYEKNDIHVHLPMGAVRKDGPSAGVPIAIALVSALTGRPVYHEIAMTGEITLRGRIMPVGGVKEKTLAAYRAGLKRLALPRKNLVDLEDIPPEVRQALTIIPVDTLDDVLALALHPIAKNTIVACSAGGETSPDILSVPPAPPVAVAASAEEVDEAARGVDKPNPLPTPAREPSPRAAIIGITS